MAGASSSRSSHFAVDWGKGFVPYRSNATTLVIRGRDNTGGAQLAPLVSQDSEDVQALELSRPPRTPRVARMTFA